MFSTSLGLPRSRDPLDMSIAGDPGPGQGRRDDPYHMDSSIHAHSIVSGGSGSLAGSHVGGVGGKGKKEPRGLSLTLGDHALGLATYFADDYEERMVLDSLDSAAIGMIYVDRLEITPSSRWRNFLVRLLLP